MAKRSRSHRKATRAKRARASEHGHETLPDAEPYDRPLQRASFASDGTLARGDDADAGELQQSGWWSSLPRAVRVGIVTFLIFAAVVLVMKFVATR